MRNLILVTLLFASQAFGAAMLHFKGTLHSFDKNEIAVHQGTKVYFIKRAALSNLPKDLKVGKPIALDVNMEDVVRTVDKK